jgi:sigma-E factor negative regulatory protein RseB
MAISLVSRAWRNGLIGLAWLLAAVGGAQAEEPRPTVLTALDWLSAMRHSADQLTYKGVVAYLKDQQVESFQLFHSAQSGQERERLVSMNSPLREVVRSAGKVACYYPDTKTVFVESQPSKHSVLLELPEDLGQLSRYYKMELQGQEYVARRLSQVVSIEPRDAYRYARRFWIDTGSKLPLKSEMLGDDGQVVEQMVFTSMDIEDSLPSRDLEPSMPVDQFAWKISHKEALPLDSLHWALHKVPDGFQIVSYTRLQRPAQDRPVEHILLSDGFASVSVYIEDLQGAPRKIYPTRVGTLNARSLEIDGHFVTVMGEVPAKAVEAIASGLLHQGAAQP